MASFYFNTAASKNVRRTWLDFIEEKFGVSSVSSGDEATFAGDIRCSSLGFLTLAQIKATHQLGERNRAQVASGTSRSKEIAFRYGFANPTHFSDAFRDHHGRSPSEVRRT